MPSMGSQGSSGDDLASSRSAVPTSHAPEREPLRRSRLGRYRICLDLASGGMATVHLASVAGCCGPDRFVALKVVHPHLTKDPGFIEMFADEARIASRIRHPNVCRVLDCGQEAGAHFLAMEYLMGENLAALFRRRAKQADELDLGRHALVVARLMADACAGLHAAHELRDEDGEPLDVVHRDVSPENIFLTHDGVAKIVDFGVAQATRQHHRTSSGFVKGKLPYLQPEAISGGALDRRADIWGIGVTMWELLTGVRLFRREGDIETLKAIDEEVVPPPSEVCPGLPTALDAIVLRALARRPGDRYLTAREMGQALLGAFASDEAERCARATRPDEAERCARATRPMQKVADLADLAEWMEALFPGGRERDAQLLEMAGRFVDGSVARGESIVEEAPTHRRSYLPPPAPLPSPSPWASLPYERRASARGRRRSWRMAFALLLGVTVGALGTRLWAEHAGWGTPRAAEAPAFAEAPHFRPTSSEVLPMRASPPEEQGRRTEDDVVPLGLARVWDPGPTASPTK